MQNAQDILLKTIEGLLEENEIDTALESLLDLDTQTQAGVRQDVILQSGNYREASKMFRNQMISFEEYQRQSARTRYALLDLMKGLPKRIALNAQVRSLNTYQFSMPDTVQFEKMIGSTNNLLKINWLEKALKASKAVCRVACADGSFGTGFLSKDGYVFTNNHVLSTAAEAQGATIEFNYEMDANGKVKSRSSYKLNAADYITSDKMELDFVRVKVIDDAKNPLSQWGFVEFDPNAIPAVGEPATIIQHPEGEDKQIALHANDVLSVWNHFLFYTADTQPGSSGSPVFNKDWKVVAIHHAGMTEKEGGMQINAKGERRGANRGILFKDIFAYLSSKKVPLPTGADQAGKESFVAEIPVAEPIAPTTPTTTTDTATPAGTTTVSNPVVQPSAPVSAVPKFIFLYDLADASNCDQINKHLTVLKMTKKIVVYNVHKVDFGDFMERAQQELETADYVLALLSSNIFNGDAPWLAMTLSAMEAGKRIIPIRVDKVDIEGTGLEKLRSLPSLNRVVSDFPNTEAAYADIAEEIKRLVKK